MRILNHVLIENLLLFTMGGTVGLGLAFAVLKFVSAGDYLDVAQVGGVRLDLRVLVFTATASLATGLFFGLFPALKASRANVSDALKTGGREVMGSRHETRARGLLVIGEIAFSLVLLAGAGLMIRSLAKLLDVNLGFNPQNVITMRLSVPESSYSIARTASFYRQLQERVKALPGVQATSRAGHRIPILTLRIHRSSAPIISAQWGYLSWRADSSVTRKPIEPPLP
jgi:hypothetical protein